MERKYLLTIEETSVTPDADTGETTICFEVFVDDVTGVEKELGRYEGRVDIDYKGSEISIGGMQPGLFYDEIYPGDDVVAEIDERVEDFIEYYFRKGDVEKDRKKVITIKEGGKEWEC